LKKTLELFKINENEKYSYIMKIKDEKLKIKEFIFKLYM